MATTVAKRLNSLQTSLKGKTTAPLIASYIPMDGYHLSRARLSSMPDPENAHARRGAAFTFDGDSFLALVKKLRSPLTPSTPTYHAPSFDHAMKDPVLDNISIPATSRILVFEGNYLALNKTPWDEIARLMDERWFVDVEEETAGKRLVPRHLKAGIATNEEDAWKRVRGNDLVNGREITSNRVDVDEVVISKEDDRWRPEKVSE